MVEYPSLNCVVLFINPNNITARFYTQSDIKHVVQTKRNYNLNYFVVIQVHLANGRTNFELSCHTYT